METLSEGKKAAADKEPAAAEYPELTRNLAGRTFDYSADESKKMTIVFENGMKYTANLPSNYSFDVKSAYTIENMTVLFTKEAGRGFNAEYSLEKLDGTYQLRPINDTDDSYPNTLKEIK